MKKNKLAFLGFASVLAFSALASACKGNPTGSSKVDPGSSSDPVSSSVSIAPTIDYIKVKAPETLVVGQTVNLDQYVEIKGTGIQPNDYEVIVKTISEDIVEVKGHDLKVLKEGNISLTIKALKEEAKFACVAISALKAAYRDATAEISKTFGFYSAEEDERSGKVTLEPFIKHNTDYLWVPNWEYANGVDSTDGLLGGGIIRIADGSTHFFTEAKDGKSITVNPKKQADYDLYYITQDFSLPYSELYTEVEVDKTTGEELEYLYVDNTSSFFDSFISYNMGVGFDSKYVANGCYVYQVVAEDGTSYWEFDVSVAYAKSPAVSLGIGAIMILMDEEECKVQACEDYIEQKLAPEKIKFDSLKTGMDKIVDAKNYTLNVEVSMYDTNGGDDVPVTDDSHDGPAFDIVNGAKEEIKVEETKAVAKYDGEVDQYYYEDGGKLIKAEKNAAGDLAEAEVADQTKFWNEANEDCAAALGSTAKTNVYGVFEVNGYTENKDGSFEYELNAGDSFTFSKALLRLSKTGKGLMDYCDRYNQEIEKEPDAGYSRYETFIDLKITFGEDYVKVVAEAQWDYDKATSTATYLVITYLFTDVGTTAVTIPSK